MGNNPSRNASGHSSAAQGSPSTSVPNSGGVLPLPGGPKRHGSQRRHQHPLHLFPQHNHSHSVPHNAPPSPSQPSHPSSTPATPIPTGSQGFYPSPARKAAPLESESVPVVRSRAISQPGEHAASHSPSWLPPGYREQGRKGSLPFAATPVSIPTKSPNNQHPSSHPGSVTTSAMKEEAHAREEASRVVGEDAGTIMVGTSEAASMPRLRKRPSVGSATTLGDEEELRESKTVPTIITWPHGGNKVYVTGTFANWRKKFPLTVSHDNIMSAVVPLPPGTHHLKFVVDDEMRTSDALPTAVDSTGILVNYIEVNGDEMPPLDRVPSNPQSPPQDQPPHSSTPASHGHPPPSNDLQKKPVPPPVWTTEIPEYLRDIDERLERFGNRAYELNVNPPPSLPMLLGKVILNSSSTMKEDNSVLSIPNHVVLNHLATSSIKNNVLAVSATTRYKKKYVTTILYKATSEDK